MAGELTPVQIFCPYCGEALEILVDAITGSQDYIEDCQICCAPIEISVQTGLEGELIDVLARRDSD